IMEWIAFAMGASVARVRYDLSRRSDRPGRQARVEVGLLAGRAAREPLSPCLLRPWCAVLVGESRRRASAVIRGRFDPPRRSPMPCLETGSGLIHLISSSVPAWPGSHSAETTTDRVGQR